jgi:dTDP-glucose 4,6-dehydratase
MKYLILGGAGVFAVHLAKHLLNKNDTEKVICVGRNKPKSKAFELNYKNDDKRYIFEQCHIVYENDSLCEIFEKYKPEYIINFAALAYATSWYKSFRYYDTNITAVAKMCEYLSDKQYLKKFLQVGTSELYGGNEFPVDENHLPKPTSPYAVSKYASDLHLQTLYDAQNFPMNIIRPSNSYGSRQYMYRIIPKAIYCGLKGIKFPLSGGGLVKKSFLHAKDLAEAIYIILTKAPTGETYNAGTDEPVTMKEIIEKVSNNLKIDFDTFVEMAPARLHEDSVYWLDSSKIKSLGWKPTITLEQGIEETGSWIKEYLGELERADFSFTLRA